MLSQRAVKHIGNSRGKIIGKISKKPVWELIQVKFAEEPTEHRFTLFGTDIDVIRPENFIMEFVLMESLKGK